MNYQTFDYTGELIFAYGFVGIPFALFSYLALVWLLQFVGIGYGLDMLDEPTWWTRHWWHVLSMLAVAGYVDVKFVNMLFSPFK